MEKLRVGVLGPGVIFSRVMTDYPNSKNCELYAVASRDAGRARAACEKYGARRWFGSYAEMLECADVELVYIATPHMFHYEHALMSLEAGKHVLCEKAFAVTAAQARDMVSLARENELFLMEAMWTRFLPAIVKLREMVKSGELGEIRHITADFSFYMPFMPQSRIFAPELAGGALLDVGIYPLSICCMLLGYDIVNIQSACIKAQSGVDARTAMQLEYKSGATAQLMGGVDVNGTSRMTVYGTKALVDIPDFWHATRLEISKRGGRELIEFSAENEGHHYQFDHAAECVRAGMTESPVMPMEESVRLMEIMTEIRAAHGIRYPGE